MSSFSHRQKLTSEQPKVRASVLSEALLEFYFVTYSASRSHTTADSRSPTRYCQPMYLCELNWSGECRLLVEVTMFPYSRGSVGDCVSEIARSTEI